MSAPGVLPRLASRSEEALSDWTDARAEPGRASPPALRTSRADVRSRRRRALAGTGPALAPLPRLAPSARRPRSRRGDGDGARRDGAATAGVRGNRSRSEPRDVGGRTPALRRRRKADQCVGGGAPARFRVLRPPHVYVPPSLRHRPGGDAGRARAGGFVASLEFGVPKGPARPLWDLYVQAVLPLTGRLLRNGWREVGEFLGGSIRDFWKRHPLERQLEWWHAASLHGVEVRRLSLGAAVVIRGRKTGTS